MSFAFSRPFNTLAIACLLRVTLLVYGRYQDAYSALKYTDIDYFVFTDAARNMAQGRSPYLRDTYRYTPLLAFILQPTSWPGLWFDYGKILFAIGDLLAGYLIFMILRIQYRMSTHSALQYASIWLLNPMVATISTRGSSEGLLAVIVIALLWATLQKQYTLAGGLLGFAIHFKIYPFIYGASLIWWLGKNHDKQSELSKSEEASSVTFQIRRFVSAERLKVASGCICTFLALNIVMYYAWVTLGQPVVQECTADIQDRYGTEFLKHTYFYHLIRTDHRHNFSPYNVMLYLNSSPANTTSLRAETIAFAPQLLISALLLPLALAKADLPVCMLAQSLAFVAFNKVCTSQYFLWYLVLLPFYLHKSSFMKRTLSGVAALSLWLGGQAIWLQQGYNLEMLGNPTFVPGLLFSSLIFSGVNFWLLGIVIVDVRLQSSLPLSKCRKSL